jgi:hypothetical protein
MLCTGNAKVCKVALFRLDDRIREQVQGIIALVLRLALEIRAALCNYGAKTREHSPTFFLGILCLAPCPPVGPRASLTFLNAHKMVATQWHSLLRNLLDGNYGQSTAIR